MRPLAGLTALLLVPLHLAGQTFGNLPPLTQQIEVHVVNVDATVIDRNGRPVRDLTREEFEILEDGVPQKITNFAVIESARLQLAAPIEGKPAERVTASDQFRRKVVLLVDNNYLGVLERNAALRAFEEHLQPNDDYDLSVAAIGRVVEVILPFTSDRGAVHDAIETVMRMPTLMSVKEVDRALLSDRQRKNMDFDSEAYDYGETVRFRSREQTYRSLMALQNTARGVAEIARAHSGDEGKKFMILITGGMESNTSYTAYDKGTDLELRELKLERAKLIDSLVRDANAANFTIHVVNAAARGMQAPQHDVENKSSGIDLTSPNFFQRGGGSDPIDVADVDSVPLSIALNTGGNYMPSNNLKESFARVDAQTANFYSLGYSPKHSGDREYHRITVNVKRRGVTVMHRAGYVDLSTEDRLEDMLRARLTFDHPAAGALPVRVDVGGAKVADKNLLVPVMATLPMDRITMLPSDNGYVGRVHVYLSVFDGQGRNVAFHHQMQEVTLTPDQYAANGSENFRYTINVKVEHGNYTFAVTLRDDLSNELGTAVQRLGL